jgi:phytanoyl-CoA hydroxylase
MTLSAEQHQRFENDGYLVVEGLVPSVVLAELRERIDSIQRQAETATQVEGQAGKFNFLAESGGTATTTVTRAIRKLSELAPADERFRAVASSPAIVDIVAALTGGGDNVMLHSDQVFLKPAFCGSEKPLHQDNSYFRILPNSAGLTCWMAIDDATIENGCLNYIPGSHKLGLVRHKPMANPIHLTPDVDFPLPPAVAVPIPAGSCIFHHLLCMHSSKANHSANHRRAWALHFANRNAADSSQKPWEQMLPMSR